MAGADMTVSTAAGGSTHADGHNSVPDSRDAGVAAADVTHADGYKADLVLGDADVAAADVADGDIIQAEAADNHGVPPSVTPAEKPKRKYVKSGKFVGKYNSWKQKQGLGTAAEGQDGGRAETACLSVLVQRLCLHTYPENATNVSMLHDVIWHTYTEDDRLM